MQLETSSITGTITKVVVNARDAKAKATLTVKVGTTDFDGTATATNTSTDYEFTGSAKGNIVVRLDRGAAETKALYIKSVVVTYTPAAATDPVINAENISLGYIRFEGDKYSTTKTLSVTGAYLENPITASTTSDKITILTESVPAEGGDFSIKIDAAGGALDEVITLTSGSASKSVKVLGRLIKKAEIEGENVTLASDSNTVDSITVNTVYGMKAGTSKKTGSLRIQVPAKTAKLRFFAAAWTGAAGNIAISAPAGVEITSTALSEGVISILADAGISGAENDYLLQAADEANFLFEFDLTGVDAATDITLASGTAQRFVIWGAKYELEEEPAGCDWDNIEFFNAGLAPEDENYNQFKICKAGENPNIVNIQVAPWADNNKGIYINFPSAEFTTISLPEGQYKVEGAGILLYLTAFTAKETEVTINYKGEDCVFTVYNVKGGSGTAIDNTVVSEKAIKMFENGQLIIIKNGVKYNALGSVIE